MAKEVSPLSGLSLRKRYWELRGWHPHTVSHDEQQAEQSDPCVLCGVQRQAHDKGMPAIESDDGIALSQIDAVCKERQWAWSLMWDGESYYCRIRKLRMLTIEQVVALEYGQSPAEAIVLALIEALESQHANSKI